MTSKSRNFDVVIPARYQSSRFPGKLLADICGKSMIQRVVEQAQTSSAERVVVAVDDQRLADEVFGTTDATVVFTSPDHASGSDRIAEAVRLLELSDDRIVVNLQGDEPLMPGEIIDQVVAVLQTDEIADIGTVAVVCDSNSSDNDPNQVKLVVDQYQRALYFSRHAIPWRKHPTAEESTKRLCHLGIYAYTVGYLLNRHSKRAVCDLELSEGLEQLRALYHGDTIAVHIADQYEGVGVDTEIDLERATQIIRNSQA